MMTCHRRRWEAVSLLVLLWGALGSGCDDIRIRQEIPSERPSITQSRSIRALFSLEGLIDLYRARHPEGLQLKRPSRDIQLMGETISVGPLETEVAIDRWEYRMDSGTLRSQIEAREVSLAVPLRVPRPTGGVRICRVRFESPAWSISLALKRGTSSPDRLQLAESPEVRASESSLAWIGSCPPLETTGPDGTSEVPSQRLADTLRPYVLRTARTAARTLFEPKPFEQLGWLRSGLTWRHVSPFEHRRGSMRTASQLTDRSLELSDEGLEGKFDVGVSIERADCVPPTTSGEGASTQTAGISSSRLDREGADVGIAFSNSLLQRLIRGTVASGVGCRGLQPPERSDPALTSIPPRRARLETVGLEEIPTSERLRVGLSPGSLPDVTLRPSANVMTLAWRELSIELYGRVARAPVRLLRLTTSFELDVMPSVASSGRLNWNIGAVEIREATFQSPWRSSVPDERELKPWARRLLVLLFENNLSLSLPMLSTEQSLNLEDLEIRRNDLLMLMSLAPSSSSP